MLLGIKHAATDEAVREFQLPESLSLSCHQGLDQSGESYANSRDIEERDVQQEIDAELRDVINIAAMGHKCDRYQRWRYILVNTIVGALWRLLHE